MAKVLADRLAEAAAEWLHKKVRTEYWGYSKDEDLDLNAMLYEKYCGIRPALVTQLVQITKRKIKFGNY